MANSYRLNVVVGFQDFPTRSLSVMHTYWVQEKMCDVEIQLEDDTTPIRAHRYRSHQVTLTPVTTIPL